MNRTLLIDGDEYVYVSCAAVEYEAEWDEQNVILASNKEAAWDCLTTMVNAVTKDIGRVDKLVWVFGSGSFRKELYPAYKAKRTKRPPLCLSQVRERVQNEQECHSIETLEGDDVLGILATNGAYENPVIVSQDKDMLTIPGTLWREGNLVYVSEGDADYHWLKQTLTGDTADGFPGCPGVGPVGAERLLDHFTALNGGFLTREAWKSVVLTFESKGMSAEEALVQARLARILRASDWDAKKKKVKLWEPE